MYTVTVDGELHFCLSGALWTCDTIRQARFACVTNHTGDKTQEIVRINKAFLKKHDLTRDPETEWIIKK